MIANQAAQHLSANRGQWRTSHVIKFVYSTMNGVPVLPFMGYTISELWKVVMRSTQTLGQSISYLYLISIFSDVLNARPLPV